MGHRIHRIPFVLTLALLAVLVAACPASADLVIGSPGAGTGQYEKPQGVAVDTSSGHVYVADTENNRVDVFDEAGAFLFAFGWNVNAEHPEEKPQTCTTASGCQKGSSGTGAGQLNHPENIAVDSASHAIYVSENENHRVQKFDSTGAFAWMAGGEVDTVTHANLCTVAAECGAGKEAKKEAGKEEGRFFETFRVPIAVGPGGAVYVADSRKLGTAESDGFNTRVQKFEPSGAYVGPQLLLPDTVFPVASLAIDSGGGIYAATVGETGAVRKYDPAGSPVTGWGESGKVDPSFNIQALALDPAGDLFVADATGGGVGSILEYNPAGAKTHVSFGNGTLELFPIALAFDHTASGDLYAVERFAGSPSQHPRVLQLALPPPGPLLIPGSAKASPLGNVRATLSVEFNPENKAGKAHFQFISKQKFEEDGNSFGAGTEETPESAPTPADFESHSVTATNACSSENPLEPTCLKPGTTYYFRAIATNADGAVTGDKAEFTTKPSLEAGATWAAEVGTDSARLQAEVNPLTIHAAGHFQYIADGSDYQEHGFEHATDSANLDFGSGESPLARAAQLTGLQPGVTYHYRLVASDPFFPPVFSAANAFTTFAAPGKAETECPENQAFRTGASAALPDCRAYELVTPLDKSNGDILTRANITGYPTNLDQSSAEGTGFTYSSYRAFANPQSAPYTNQYLANRDPGEGWQSEAIDPPRGPQFRVEIEDQYKAFTADLSNSWLLQESEPTLDPCAPAGFADLYRRTASGAYEALSCAHPSHQFEELIHEPFTQYMPELEGFSADGSHAVFRIDDALAVSTEPPASGATNNGNGIRPIYQVYESSGAGQLHLISVLPNGEAAGTDSSAGTALINEVANHNRFQIVTGAVSEDGTRVFWSTSTGGQGPIYLRLNADQKQSSFKEGKCNQPTKACTIAVSGGEPAYFQGADPQGTKALYKVSAGQNKGNLYEFDSEAKPPASQLIAKGVMGNILGASEDLARVYFASEEATAQQEAEGAAKGKPNLYLYDEGTTRFIGTLSSGENSDLSNPYYGSPVATSPIERTARVSPDGQSLVFMSNSKALSEANAGYDNTDALSGEADAEVYLYDTTANEGKGKLRCVSCNPSGARPVGRFFAGEESNKGTDPWAAATVPRFESQLYQPRYLSDDGRRVFFDSFDPLVLGDTNGKEDVYEWEAVGGGCTDESPTFSPASEGCLRLISSGQSSDDSKFLDASPSGADAFFTTAESLLPSDYGLIDVYDARVNGGFPAPPPPPPACEGDACQSPAAPPNDPTPASSSFEGAPNPAPRKHASKHKHKRKQAQRKHRREHRHHGRAAR